MSCIALVSFESGFCGAQSPQFAALASLPLNPISLLVFVFSRITITMIPDTWLLDWMVQ
jgi:hypothetical protein